VDAVPGDPLLRRTLANLLWELGRQDEAVQVLRASIDALGSKVDFETLNDLAWDLLTAKGKAEGRNDEALGLARKLLEAAPRNASILNTCGLAFLRAGESSEAWAVLRRADWLYRAAGAEPRQRGENLLLLSIAAHAAGKPAEAREALDAGASLAPESTFLAEARDAAGGKP
jgi:Flp pilus assembly protein TadD